jgi:Tfp pilus assembly protein PilO
MNKLPKEKRDQLILVIIVTVTLLVAVYFGLIRPQYANIAKIQNDTRAAQQKLVDVENTINKSEATTTALFDISDTLSHAEEDMASGDTYAWTFDTIRNFKTPYKVEIPPPGQPTTGDVDLLANFPYRQLKFTISGTAYYHDLGDFIAHFENNFPHIRVVNITLDPSGESGDDSEKLSFRMDIIALIKPNGAGK